ncbi:MAG TPA: class I SAM-dependent methyltransferase [Candidatus Acidoferrales bacterium]|nr:class I SAM-dependent methyltransferase [Candidatus Acidoferrales bacterium]
MAFDWAIKHERSTFADKLAYALREGMLALASANLAALKVLLTKGWRPATQLVSHNYKLYSGFGLNGLPLDVPWRTECTLPSLPPDEIFRDIDFSHSPPLIFPKPTALSISTLELIILCQLIRAMKPDRVIEFGTATGRTAANLAANLPPGSELITVDIPEGSSNGKWLYLELGADVLGRIKQLECDLTTYDWSTYRRSAGIVFCDACDTPKPFAKETELAFDLVTDNGIILWHDYGYSRFRTKALNKLGTLMPVWNIAGTNLACVHVTPSAKIAIQGTLLTN